MYTNIPQINVEHKMSFQYAYLDVYILSQRHCLPSLTGKAKLPSPWTGAGVRFCSSRPHSRFGRAEGALAGSGVWSLGFGV